MRRPFLHLLAALALGWLAAGCVAAPITPVFAVQYPATWTPAPTPTNTPPGPTATLVIQSTPLPPATRDPNARRLPSAPRGGIGAWLDTSTLAPESLQLLAPRAQVFAALALPGAPRNPNQIWLYKTVISDTTAVAAPLNPAWDGLLLENAAAASADMLAALRQRIAPRLFLLDAAPSSAADAAPRLAQADGICYCNFLRAPDAPLDAFETEEKWLRDVNTLAALTADPNAVVLTATQFAGDDSKSGIVMQGWFDYALGSYLMGVNNGRTFFGFQGKGAQELIGSQALTVQLGAPQGAMLKANAVYQRRFARGLALVNPAAVPRALALARNYYNLNGGRMTEVKLPPHSGMILLNAEK